MRLSFTLPLAIVLSIVSLTSGGLSAQTLELKKGDHICIIGNTLAEGMQHDGWLETRLQARFADHQLVIRNLAYSADEVELSKRLRSMDFGSPDQWLAGEAPIPQPGKLKYLEGIRTNRFELTGTKADVIFAFFGYNESFAGPAGLEAFKKNLASFLQHTLAQKYNGKSAPRVVLFSPIAHENLKNRNLPDGSENNARLKLYSAAMAEVAKAEGVVFVDLFTPSQELYTSATAPLTKNGIHPTPLGNQLLAQVIDKALFPTAIKLDGKVVDNIRQQVQDKNFCWFQRYRTTDGFSIYGDRAFIGFTNDQSNYEVGQRELEVLDVLTSNRDQRIWDAAQGKAVSTKDENLPPFLKVETNRPGPLPDKSHEFLSGEAAIEKMTVHKGMKVNLFASEEKFPELINPVQMAFDPKGRLWVAAWPNYPHWKPTDPMNDKLLILEDTNGDGVADKCIPFADNLQNPTGFEFWGGGVIVAMAPDILFLKDTNGDDKADVRISLLNGLDTADTHHTANSFTLDPGGALYFQEGTFHHTQVETPWGAPQRVANGAVFRYEPRTQKFSVYVSYGFANPHGHIFDRWGQDIVVDGTGAVPYHGALFSGHLDYPEKHGGTPSVYQQRTRPCSGLEILSSQHFPEEMQGNLLVPNVIGFQGILRYKLTDNESSLGAVEQEPILSSSDQNFRPTDVEMSPEGAIYLTDWQNPIIGHLQHNLRDPSRDRVHGRVYRVTYEGRPLTKPVPVAGESIAKLVSLLAAPEDRVRARAKIELSSRESGEVIAAVNQWLTSQDKNGPAYEHQVLEALWVHQHHNVVNTALLERVLKSPDFRARAAAVRVLCYWRDQISSSLALVKTAAGDEHPRVRLEAIRAASFFPVAEAVEVPLIAAELPVDSFIEHLTKETMRALQPHVDKAKNEGRRVAFSTPAGARYFLRNLSVEQLLKEPRSREVYFELLLRPGLQDAQRQEAIAGLAKADQKSELRVVMDSIGLLDAGKGGADTSVVFDLIRQLTGRSAAELTSARAELEKLATSAKQPLLRQIGFVSLISVDGSVDKSWELATTDAKRLIDLVNAVPLISDAGVKASLYEKLEPLLKGLPGALGADPKANAKGTVARFVRVELPRRGTLTLAEVEVYSNGVNVARQGKASQKNIGAGGDPKRGIDGNKSDTYNDGGQTHTEENTENPWWEVDLGEEMPLESVAIFNRKDGSLGDRLQGFTLKGLDAGRGEVFKQENLPAPKWSASIEMGGGGAATLVRRAAMQALTQIRGQESKTFKLLTQFVKDDADRSTAIRALQKIPRANWGAEEAAPLLDVLTKAIKKIPVTERTSATALEALEFADTLTTLLPADEAKKLRAELSELGVRVVRIGTLFERMSYDKDVVAIKAGKPVEFLLENSDLMPHNFVILQPGSLEEMGLLAEASAQQPSFAARFFVPDSNKVLAASTLLQPRASQKISFVAPTEPGIYPFVCTYPGHWRRMFGALYVVADLDAYLADSEKYLAEHPLEAKDALLKDRRPRTEWKTEDLVAGVEKLQGRNFAAGRQMFQVGACISCHKMEGKGNQFGPDLTKLDPKLKPADILKEIIEPSAKINEKFQTEVFVLSSGKVVTGLVLEETKTMLKVIENPLAKAEPVQIAVEEIETRKKSPTSIMPKGLLDKLTRDEIFDLVAYIAAKGDKASPLFGPGGHDHHQH